MTCTCRNVQELEHCECATDTDTLVVVIPGEPVGKERPRFARTRARASGRRGGVRTFTAPKTMAWEQRAAQLGRRAAVEASWTPDPKARYAAEVLAYRTHMHRGPDLDNLVKAALDALNGIAWTDDARVRELHAVVVQDAEPRVVVRVWRLS